ncbi:erythromycin esterase family protein [Deinococcus sp. QL22]|uniref:erythromycin esterase family protein n=1 Tax=Deinococcus sp. QL22 TaxID=2939437 RepID=UPI0020177E58|nr:erythromycin esterase family protein [Deinococcus sp. QL22]UQN08290.1 erythromycin esterase family protein [Deinococcus sp. QL22]
MPHPTSPLGWPMTDPAAALSAFLATLPAPPQLLGLGEPTHGVEAFPLWRNRVFQTLVDTQGFRSIAIESDILAGLRVDAHIASGQGTLNEVMTDGFSHGFGEEPANRELVVWMRQFNSGRNELDRLRFYGFDPPLENRWAASPRHALLALHDFLARHCAHLPVDRATLEQLCGDDARWINPAAAMDPSQSVGATPDAWHLRALADDLVGFLETQHPGLGAHPGLWTAQLHARTALGLLRYHANLAAPSPDRISQMLALRAVMMTDNLLAIAEREEERGPTLVFAHTSHLQRGASQIRMETMNADWWPAGAQLLGRDAPYAVLALSNGEGAAALVPNAGEGLGRSGAHLYATPGRLERDGVLTLPEAVESGER